MLRYTATWKVPNVDVDRAFAYVSDFRHAAVWDPMVTSATKVTPGPIGVGTEYVLSTRIGGCPAQLPYRITGYAPSKALVLEGESSLMRYRDEIEFAATSTGMKFTYHATASLRGLYAAGNLALDFLGPAIGDQACAGISRALRNHCGNPREFTDLIDHTLDTAALDAESILRNLLITQTYFEISQALAEMTGWQDANWCTFGTWASKTAGTFIRDEEVPPRLASLLGLGAREYGMLGAFARLPRKVGMYIEAGNKQVFMEIATLCARFIGAFAGAEQRNEDELQAFLGTLTEGDPEPDRLSYDDATGQLSIERRGGQGDLRSMIRAYYEAMFESDPQRKAELMLLGSACGGLHEQTRLQAYIAGSIEAPSDELLEVLHLGSGSPCNPLARVATQVWRLVATSELMTMPLPDGVLHLGADIPASPGHPLFPAALRVLRDPTLIDTLDQFGAYGRLPPKYRTCRSRVAHGAMAVLQRLGIEQRGILGSAATDWVSFPDRMHFILEYFRSRQQDRALLYVPPFSAVQTDALRRGLLPDGPLS